MPSRVLIIGGGIGGLALAQGMKKHNIPFHIYEKDESSTYRAQGYRIRISGKGTEALRHLFDKQTWSLLELMSAETRLGPLLGVDGVKDEDAGSIMIAGPGTGDFSPFKNPYTLDRTMFRELLLRGLEEHISYGHAFTSYATSADEVTQVGAVLVATEPIVFSYREGMNSAGVKCPKDYLYWVTAAQSSVYGWEEDSLPDLSPGEAEKLA